MLISLPCYQFSDFPAYADSNTRSEGFLRGAKTLWENIRGMKFCEKFVRGTKFS